MRRTGSFFRVALLVLLLAAVPANTSAVAFAPQSTGAGEEASPARVTAGVSAARIGLDDTLLYTLTFRNIDNPAQPDLSYLDDFKVLQTARSSEFQIRAGASSTSTRFTYYLMPARTGRLSLPAVHYRHQGSEFNTAAFTVEVVKGSLVPGGVSSPGPSSLFDDDFFSSPFGSNRRQKVDAYLRAAVSKTACFKGQQLLFRVLLYTRNRIEAVNMLSSASFTGFWQEWFPVPQSIPPTSENINGVIYQVYEIRKAALFANESGTLAIPPLQFELQLADPGSAFLAAQALRRSTQEVKVQVSEPPAAAAGLPLGQFSFALESPRQEADVNEIVTIKMRISGSGNTKAVIPPTLPASDMALVYPAKITHQADFAAAAMTGTLIAEIPVSFKRSGEVVFPSLEFRYYDPAKDTLVSLRSDPIRLRVNGEKQAPALSRTLPSSAVMQEGEDIEFIKSGPWRGLSRPIHRQFWFAFLFAALFAANLLVLLKVTAWDRGIAASSLMRHRRILARALKQLDNVRRTEDIAPVMESYFCAKSGLGLSEVNDRRIASTLAVKNVSKSVVDRFLFIKGQSELARFSPGKRSALELRKELQSLRELFRAIDRKMR